MVNLKMSMAKIETSALSTWRTTATLAIPLLVLLCGGLWFYHAEKSAARLKAQQQLAAIAHLKVDQLVAWRKARLDDATLLMNTAPLSKNVTAYFIDSEGTSVEELRNQLHNLQEHGQYAELLVVDLEGRVRLSVNGQQETLNGYAAALAEALRTCRPVFTDLHTETQQPEPHISLVVPVFSADRHASRPLGAVILINNAAQFLQPLLDSWMKPSKSMEVILVRRDGDTVVFLNALRKHSAAASKAPTPLHLAGSLAAMAASGQEGFVEGDDARGIESLAVLLHVPGSDWRLIAKDDASEIFGVWRFRAALLMLLFAVLAGGLGCLGLFVRQYNQRAYYKALYGAEARLRQSIERHSITLKAIGEGIITIDTHGRVELLNPVAEMLTGWSYEEAFGRPLEEVFCLVDAETRAQVHSSVIEVLQDGRRTDEGSRKLLIAKNGIERAITNSASPMYNDRGTVIGAVLVFQDQTDEQRERRLIQVRLLLREYAFTHSMDELVARALQESAALVDSATVFWQVAGPKRETVVLRCRLTSEAKESGGMEYGEEGTNNLDQTGIWPALLGEGRPVIQNDLSLVPFGEEKEYCRFGTLREAVVPVLQTGKVVAVLGVADKPDLYTKKDIDIIAQIADDTWRLIEQKKIEEALLSSERRYRTLYRSMMDAFVVTDMHGNIRECNEAYSAMLGYTNEELKQLSVKDITPDRWLPHENDQVKKQLIHRGCSNLYEKEYRRKDGTVFPVELRTFFITDNDGLPEGMSAVVRDISERKLAEEEREKLRERLNQSQKMESIGQLAGGVAHDFNNMLSVILGYAELALRKVELSDPLYKNIQEIVRAGRRSADITRQLLAFARKQTIVPKMLDLNDTMGRMLTMLQRLIGEDVELKWLPGCNLWPVMMDPAQVDQLLANLCVNARDAVVGAGKITIETGMVSFDEVYCAERAGFIPGDFVMLAVSDNGCGIERDLLDKIFEPFFTTKGVGEGTGLGLATVYGIVKQNNGFINVYSEPGEGTTFRIYLPRMEGPVEERGGEILLELQKGQGESVLVVEDEEAILALNRTMLEHLGYAVLTASSPRQALQQAVLHADGIDLLITDVIMPEMNGRDLAGEMQALYPNIKVLFVSGYTENVIAHRGVLDKGVCFLPKPFSLEELAAKVRETLWS
jgi:PAS domain S-box-containing protein